MRNKITLTIVIAALALTGCAKEEKKAVVYDSAPVVTRDIVVAVEAAGLVEPFLTVEVKSKASGEILRIMGETGDQLTQGELLVEIDKRSPRNQLAQAQAELEAAQARRSIADAQTKRSKTLLESRTINDVDYEQSVLEFANAKAEVIRAEVAVENARIALDDTAVKAPITGTIIEKLVEPGQVISSPTMDVGGGTLLLKMADLTQVQVKTLVDETDIGKIRPDQPVTVTVTSFPNQPFEGRVSKIEPKAMDEQTVTTFSVLIVLDNESGLLRPGMNADVEIRIAEVLDVTAVPTAALRVEEDIEISSQLLGIPEAEIRASLEDSAPARPADTAGETEGYSFANRYWVLVQEPGGPRAVSIDTGLTDLDYNEVLAGLEPGTEVMLLPSSGLVRSRQMFQARVQRFMAMPGMSGSKDKDKDKDKKDDKGKKDAKNDADEADKE